MEAFTLSVSETADFDAILITCHLYDAKSKLEDIGQLQLHIFEKSRMEGHKRPPTESALRRKVLRVRYQLLYDVDVPDNHSPEQFGWLFDKKGYVSVPTSLPAAP